jgi:enediyne biosynthesis protein E4
VSLRDPIWSRRCFLAATAAMIAGASRGRCFGLPAAASRSFTTPKIEFENAVSTSGIRFTEDNSASPHKFQIETMTGGVALFDYNNDGLLDIYFANGARLPDLDKSDPKFFNRLYRNNGDGTFTDVTEAAGVRGDYYSMGIAAADYDNDGHQDLFVAGANGFQLFHNEGDGTFIDVTAKAGLLKTHPDLAHSFSVAAGWFDYDNDGHLDLMIINYLKWSVATDVSCTTKGIRAYCSPNSYAGTSNLLFHNNGDGTFTDVSESSGILQQIGKGMGVAFADYDGDGFVDIFVTNDTFRNFLFHNNGNGTFTEVGILEGVAYNEDGKSIASMGVDFRDIDNDGRPDAFITAMRGDTFPLFHSSSRDFFEDRTMVSKIGAETRKLTAWGTGIFDFDNDGWKDIFIANAAILDNSEVIDNLPYKLPNTILQNNGDGTFADVSATAGRTFQVPAAHRGAAFGDLNNDGLIDAVTNCLDSAPEVWINRTRCGNHWLLINLVGSKSNRDGLGATIKLTSAGGTQYNQATTSVGYGSASDKRVHFGLGSDKIVQQIKILWPSGITQTLSNVAADQVLVVHEAPGTLTKG